MAIVCATVAHFKVWLLTEPETVTEFTVGSLQSMRLSEMAWRSQNARLSLDPWFGQRRA